MNINIDNNTNTNININGNYYYYYHYHYYYHQYYYKLAVVSHLFKMNQLKVNFGLLRDPYFLAAHMGAVNYRFVF